MPSASALREQIEHSLQHRFAAALSPVPRTVCEVAPTGVTEVDRLLDGGLPVGAISELTGPESSGRTSLALAFLSSRTREGRVCAWVDANDSLDPESAAASGINLKQLLWVRCGNVEAAVKNKLWTHLDQAIRSTDLLLQASGFAALVLGLGSTSPEHASRIPLATWFRFRQAANRTRCSLLVLGRSSFAQSSAALVLECSPVRAKTAGQTVLSGFHYQIQRTRQRNWLTIPRKPPVSTWTAPSHWGCEAPSRQPMNITQMEKRA